MVRAHAGATRAELATAVCREWDWRRANGALRLRACRDLLLHLAEKGLIELPASRLSVVRRRAALAEGRCFETLPDVLTAQDIALRNIVVRPIEAGELPRWREAMRRFHYLGDGTIVGETLRQVAESEGRWVALLGWGAAALKSRHREAWVGWDERVKYRRLHLVADNVRFLVLPWVRVPCLASAVLSRSLRRLSADWQEYYGHPILLAETFVALSRFRGTCYRAANWIYLGETRGMRRKGAGYEEHGNKKGLFVYPLDRRTREILAAPFPSPQILRRSSMPAVMLDVNKLPLEGAGGLIEVLGEITDPRKRRGIRHPFASVLALAVMAALSGMRSYEAIAEWASDLPEEILRQLRCWCRRAPSEPTFRRVLQSVDASEIDEKVGQWLAHQAGGGAISLDGKALRGSADGEKPVCHLLAAITHDTGVVVAQEQVAEKSNEIPAVQPLLKSLDLRGATVTADAMHTQRTLARHLVEEKQADYVFIAKDNQPTLREDIETLDWESRSFSPQAQSFDKGHGRIETRTIWLSDELVGYLDFPHANVVFRLKRETSCLDGSKPRTEVVHGVTSRRGTQARDAEQLLTLVRGHWTVENRLHWVRDVTFDEDRSQVRKRNGPRVMASLRNLAISVLRLAGARYVAKAVRWCSRNVQGCLRLIGLV